MLCLQTFTFAQSTNDEDTEKCIAFWRSVMEKNLQPVRCSIVENREYQPKDNVADGPYKGEKESDPKPNTVELSRKTRCKMCETLDARFDEDVCGDEATIDKEIKDLNKWKSTAKKKVYAAGASRGESSLWINRVFLKINR
nr:unnamed protein product [Callosobruchus chinensis]